MTERGTPNSSEDSAALSACKRVVNICSMYIVYVGVESFQARASAGQRSGKRSAIR